MIKLPLQLCTRPATYRNRGRTPSSTRTANFPQRVGVAAVDFSTSRTLTSVPGAATSLKYAKPEDLPSFPSAGLKLASASAAASIADNNKKSFEHWKPGASQAANRAADKAQNYQMDPLWQPEASKAGNSAAGQALRMKPVAAITERESPADSRSKALQAATGAMAGGRKRAESAPPASSK